MQGLCECMRDWHEKGIVMATLMQSRIEALKQEPLDSESVVRALQPWRRRLSVQKLLRWTTRGIAVGLLLACIMLLIARLTPWPNALTWAIGSALACTLLAMGIALWRRPSLAHTHASSMRASHCTIA